MDAEDRKLRPLLRSVRLRSATFSNSVSDLQSVRLRLVKHISIGVGERENETEVEAEAPKSVKKKTEKRAQRAPAEKPRIGGLVSIELTATFELASGETVDDIAATASYQGRFVFHKEAQLSDIEKALEVEPYQYQFVAQAYPIAIRHFKDQLLAMGLTSRSLPLGIT